jgi:hypothetical protein
MVKLVRDPSRADVQIGLNAGCTRTSQQSSDALLPLSLSSTFFTTILCYWYLDMILFDLVLCPFLSGSSLVQQTQICLPTNRNNASKDAPVLYGYICETKSRDCGPHLAGVNPACGYGVLNAFNDFGERRAREQRVHAEEVGVEERSE